MTATEETPRTSEHRLISSRNYTVVLVPHNGSRFVKFRFTRAASLTGILFVGFIIMLLAVSLFLNHRLYALYGVPLSPDDVDPDAIATSLEVSTKEIDDALREARRAMVSLQEAAKDQKKELEEVRGRYESLRILADGQEQIAEAHRRILQDVGPIRRTFDIAIGLFVGIVGGIASNAIWVSWKKRESQTADDLRREIRQQVLDEIEEQQREDGLADDAILSRRDDYLE